MLSIPSCAGEHAAIAEVTALPLLCNTAVKRVI